MKRDAMKDITSELSTTDLSRLAWRLGIDPQRMWAAGDRAAAILAALQEIRDVCDGARTRDGQGFSRYWAPLGHWLAEQQELTSLQAAVGQHIVLRHCKQIPPLLRSAAIGDLIATDLRRRRLPKDHRPPLTDKPRSEGLARSV